jgi:hypothetical protein
VRVPDNGYSRSICLYVLDFYLLKKKFYYNYQVDISTGGGGGRGRGRMVFGFTTIFAISAYQHQLCEFESRSGRGVLDATLCDKVSPPVCSTKKNHKYHK